MTSRTLSKEKIIAIAIELINEKELLTFTKIGKKLGTRSQAIYNYYPDVMSIKISVAANFFDKLALKLQSELLGLSGKEALKKMANISIQYSLNNFLVAQQILSIPVEKANCKELNESIQKVHKILTLLLHQVINNKNEELVISRMVRDLIIGEIVHVGNGRFNNDLMSSENSFNQMMNIILLKY